MSQLDRVTLNRVRAVLSGWERELIAEPLDARPSVDLERAVQALRAALYGSEDAPFWYHLTRDGEQLDIAVVADTIVSPEHMRGMRADDTLSRLFNRERWQWSITSSPRISSPPTTT